MIPRLPPAAAPSGPHRRAVLAGFASVAAFGRGALAQADAPLALRAAPADGGAVLLNGAAQPPVLRLARGAAGRIALDNALAQPLVADLFGTRFLESVAPVAPGARAVLGFATEAPGTFWLRLRSEGLARPLAALVVVEQPGEAVADREETLVIARSPAPAAAKDGSAAGAAFKDRFDGRAAPAIIVNGTDRLAWPLAPRERLRLRVLNADARMPCSVALTGGTMRVIALDGQPSEPFLAREGRIGLGPGNRADLLIDGPAEALALRYPDADSAGAVRFTPTAPPRAEAWPDPAPLAGGPSPATLELRNALRADFDLAALPAMPGANPAFRLARGRVAVLALANRGAGAVTVRLTGHSARLLDALDDGWKPFWLDTVLVAPGRTERVAFRGDWPGRWRIEAAPADPALAEAEWAYEVS